VELTIVVISTRIRLVTVSMDAEGSEIVWLKAKGIVDADFWPRSKLTIWLYSIRVVDIRTTITPTRTHGTAFLKGRTAGIIP
jgi:hypothetical protein